MVKTNPLCLDILRGSDEECTTEESKRNNPVWVTGNRFTNPAIKDLFLLESTSNLSLDYG